jgi:hypothetical protein
MALLQKAYLGATPLFRDTNWYEDAPFNTVNISSAVTVTADSIAHTKGAWAQIVSSTSANASLLYIRVSRVGNGGTNTATLLDIGAGPSGSETAIAENIAIGSVGNSGDGNQFVMFSLPCKLASGTRISARIQSVVTGGKTATVTVFVLDAGNYDATPASVGVIGTSTANSQGTSFSGASGTWVEGIASTASAYRAVGLVLSAHSGAIANVIDATFEVGVGASGSEVSFGQLRHSYTASETAVSVIPFVSVFGRNIPSGSRLAVRHAIAANPSLYGFTLIGIP